MRVLFLVTEDWYFVSHRLKFAEALIERGYEVGIACSVENCEEEIKSSGIQLFPVSFNRDSLSPLSILTTSLKVRRVVKLFKPDLIHNVALRPILIGLMAGIDSGTPRINAIAGMGSVFTSRDSKNFFIGLFLKTFLGICLRNSKGFSVFQNSEDYERWSKEFGLESSRTFLIKGAGVNCSEHKMVAEPSGKETILLFAGRLLKSKGVNVLVQASGILREKGIHHTLRVAGDVDKANTNSISRTWIENLDKKGFLEWLGRRDDILNQMDNANIVVLPTYYGEGLPKVLLEAGVAGRAVVTTDIVGCREVVVDEENGLLVPPKSAEHLAHALERLITNSDLRSSLAHAHANRVRETFSSETIYNQFFELYDRILLSK
jgi:glycosyltransferase involved in cell wall biosynthesis